MFTFRHLAPVFLIASTFFAPAYAASVNFTTVVVDYASSDADTPFLGAAGTGTLTYADEFVEAIGPSILKGEQLSFTVTSLGQEFTDADVSEHIRPFALFFDGDLFAFSFVVTEDVHPNPAEINEPGVLAIGSAPHGMGRDDDGNLRLDLWVNGPTPELTPGVNAAVPLPGGLVLMGGALTALAHLRRRKKTG